MALGLWSDTSWCPANDVALIASAVDALLAVCAALGVEPTVSLTRKTERHTSSFASEPHESERGSFDDCEDCDDAV